jgi:hypothetical protein
MMPEILILVVAVLPVVRQVQVSVCGCIYSLPGVACCSTNF